MSGKTFRASDFAKLHEIIVVCLLFHLSSSDINIYTCRICRLPLQSLVCCGPGEDGDLEVLKFLYRCFFSHYRPRIQNRGSGGGSLGLKWRPTSRDPNSGIIKGGGRAGCWLPPPPPAPPPPRRPPPPGSLPPPPTSPSSPGSVLAMSKTNHVTTGDLLQCQTKLFFGDFGPDFLLSSSPRRETRHNIRSLTVEASFVSSNVKGITFFATAL